MAALFALIQKSLFAQVLVLALSAFGFVWLGQGGGRSAYVPTQSVGPIPVYIVGGEINVHNFRSAVLPSGVYQSERRHDYTRGYWWETRRVY